MSTKTGGCEKRDFKGGCPPSGTIAGDSPKPRPETSATSCTDPLRGTGAGSPEGFAENGRNFTVNLTDEVSAAVSAEAAQEGLSVGEFLSNAIAGMFEPVSAKRSREIMAELKSRKEKTGLLPADAPFTEWEILLDEKNNPFRVIKVHAGTIHTVDWREDPKRKSPKRVIFTHADARAMRRVGIPKELSLGDVLIWGDKPCRVTRLPSADELARATPENTPTMTVAGDWLEAGELLDAEVPYCVAALHVRFMRFALPAERDAFERADKIREDRAIPSRTGRPAMKKARHEDPTACNEA